jgi:acyl carrier protein
MKKNLKKYTIISFVFVGLLFTSGKAYAENNTNFGQTYNARLGIITQLMQIAEKYPQFSDVINPFIEEHLESIFADMDSYKNRGQQQKAAVKERNELRKEIKKDYSEQSDYSANDIDELEAEPYENVDGKWKVKVEFDNDREYTLYVYDVDDEDELVSKIVNALKEKFGFEISESDVDDILKIDDDSNDDDEAEYSVDNISELEAEPYENIDNKWEVEIEFGDDEDYTFYVYDIYSDDELVSNIADKIEDEFDFKISDSEVADILEIND